MSVVLQEYHKKREKLLAQMTTIKELEKEDEIIGLVLNISRDILSKDQSSNIEWLLNRGNKLVQYGGFLDRKYVEEWGGYRVAEMAFKSIRDALIITSKADYKNVTEAKAAANRDTQEAEIDALAREMKSELYKKSADFCKNMVMFIQTTLKWREHEYTAARISERGNRPPRN